jgi:dTDP-4-amino-4,6-dideoxygalactose transaminase
VGQQTVSLPLSARLTDADVADVITAVRRVLNQ